MLHGTIRNNDCMLSINWEKLAQRQNSECCNADFWPVHLRFVLKIKDVSENQF